MEVDQIDTPEHFTSTLCATFTVCDLSNFVKEYPIEDVTYSFVIETNFDFSPKNTLVKAYTKFTKTTLDLNKIQSYDLFIPETMCTFSECYPLTNSFLISIKTPKTIVRDENGIQCDLPANPVVIDPEGFRLQKLFDKHIMNSVDDLCRSPQKAAENSRDTGIQSKMEHLNSPIEKNSIVRSKYTVAPNLEPWYCDLHELGENGTLCLNKLKRHMIDIIKCFLDHNELLTNISTVNGQMFFSKNYLQCLDEAQKEAVENLNSNSKNNSEFLTKFVDQIVKKRSYNDQTFTNGHSTRVGDNVGTLSNLSQRVFVKKETTENCFCTIDDITVQVNNQPVNLSTILKNLESCKDKLTTVNTGNTLSNVNLNDNDQKQDINTPSPQKRKNNNGGKGKHTQIKEELKKCQSDLQLNNNTLYVCNTNYTNAAANHERCEAALNDTKNEFSKSEETLNSTSKSLSECESKRKDVSDSAKKCQNNLTLALNDTKTCNTRIEDLFNKFKECNVSLNHSHENVTSLLAEMKVIKDNYTNVDKERVQLKLDMKEVIEKLNNILLIHGLLPDDNATNISNVLVASEENRTKLKTELESTEETTGNLSSQITKKKKNISELEEELKKVKETNGKISKDLETSTKDIEKLLAKVKTVEEKKTNIETQTEACKNTVTQLTEDLQTLRDAKMNITSKLDELEKKSSRLEANLQNLTEAKQTILNDLERSQKYLVKFVCQNYVGWKSQEEYNACLLQSPIHYSKALDQGVAYKDDGLVANGKYYPKSVFYLDVCSALTSTNSNPLTKATNNDHLCVDKLRQCYEARNTCVMKMFEQQVRLQSYLDSNDTKIADELTCDPMYNMHIELLSFFNKHMNYISSCLMNQDNDSHEFNLSSIKYVRSANDPVRHSESSEKENQKSSPALLSKRANVQKPVNGHVISTDEKQILEDLSVLNNLLGKLLRENTLTNPNKQNAQVSTNILLNNNIQSGSSHGNNVNINALVNLKYDANKPLQKIPSSWCTEEGKKNPRVAKAIELFGLLPENYQFLKQNAAVLSRMFDSDDLEKAVKVLSEPQIFLTTITKNIKPDEFTNLTESSINEKKKLNDPQGNNTELIFDQFSDNKKKIGHSKDAGIKQPNLQNTQTTEESSSDLEKSENIMPEKKQYPDANNIQPTIDQTSQKKLANINKPISILQQPSNATNPPVRVGNIVNQTLDEKKYTTGSEGENTTSRTTNVKQLALVATGGLFVVGAVSALSWYLWIKKDRTTQDALGLQASESMYDWDDQLDDISALQ
ncbi:uncharacterized protein LOC128884472 [Hylaeus volcanicus]|uniref:uncharacterized protein LOC128884472 n=1 Tax=Hylaeus volcanicus TaxID=313075 RepID=UPI0023B82A52|nr:uncharacterized protein LOC128884472 [Hylaeus volcanicus]